MEDIKSCFGENSIQKFWSENGKIYIAITEDEHWWKNKCVLRDWYFDYEKFKTLNMHVDCESYGVYVFWEKFCEKHEQPMWKNGLKCGGCLTEEEDLLCMKCNTEHEGNWCPEAEEDDDDVCEECGDDCEDTGRITECDQALLLCHTCFEAYEPPA